MSNHTPSNFFAPWGNQPHDPEAQYYREDEPLPDEIPVINTTVVPESAWSAEREFEIRLHELVTGIRRVECRTDPTPHGRNGEPQFALGGQAGHDYAPAYLTDERAALGLIPEIFERTEGFANVDLYREEAGDFACVIFGTNSSVFGPSTTTQRAMTRAEALARAAFDWFTQERGKAV